MQHFLIKTEPGTYSFDDLAKERHTTWSGVTNALALKHIRSMKEGDECVLYHTGDERQGVGIARVIRAPYVDPKANNPKLIVVDLLCGERFPKPVTLASMREMPVFQDFDLLRLPRLSIVPMTNAHYLEMIKLAGLSGRRR
ncbi:MAG: EVE domain-containing protein [Planctomycetota bacterium]